MAPAAVTHANDMSQRNVPLAATVQSAGNADRQRPGRARARAPHLLHAVRPERPGRAVGREVHPPEARPALDAPPDPPRDPRSTPPTPRRRSPPALRRPRPRRRPRSSSRSSEASSSFECRRRHRRLGELRVPGRPLTGLSAGPHTFAARATDPAGNTDRHSGDVGMDGCADPGDTSAPETTDRHRSARFVRPPRPPRSTFLQRGGLGLCLPPRRRAIGSDALRPPSTSVSPRDAHAFEVRATDQAGNTDDTPATWAWTVAGTAAPAPGPGGTGRRRRRDTGARDAGPVGPLASSTRRPRRSACWARR